ncbi:MAG: hypothetical protein N3G78_11940 [Desulfobacterota bacterium]|nr:hypothetical protein [Thermodesulfobacteriota bacterium]
MLPGLTGKAEMVVQEEDLVSHIGPFQIHVLSTPRLIQLMEEAAIQAIEANLPPDRISLGTQIRMRHLAPTPLGMRVVSYALLKEIQKNRLLFQVEAYDEEEKVAEGEHERVLVSKDSFGQKVDQKRARSPRGASTG